MKSLTASVRDGGGLDRVDHAVQWLEEQWRQHGAVELERFWSDQKRVPATGGDGDDDSAVLLTELIKTDLRCRFARSQTPTVAEYLERFPELRETNSRVLSLIYEEFCLLEERGAGIDVESFCNHYPQWKTSLVSQLQYHHLFSQAAGARPAAPAFPEPGEKFEEFDLIALLGKGGTSRVFLARDLSLGGKQVVLKVSLDKGPEPQVQGPLDHPHIVPVNSVVFGDRQLRGLSMPYRPGLPLDEVIKRVNPAQRPRRAIALWKALDAGPDGDRRREAPRGDGWAGFPVRGTYARGAAWIVMIVARALDYAHKRQTFHRDVKPGNVLLTLDHGPQLLDFNLAESPHSAQQAEAAIHGGTLPYMAPEQIEAFLNPDLWGQVGARADIYSLGLVLRELLTGQAPDLPAQELSPPRALRVLLDRRPLLDVSVRRANPAIPYALEAIVARCLKFAPADRYPDAAALAEDLDRFLRQRPLRHAVNPSRRERARNYLRRNWLNFFGLAACLMAIGVATFRPAINRLKPIEHEPSFLAAVQHIENDQFDQAEERLQQIPWWYHETILFKLYSSFALDRTRETAGGGDPAQHPATAENIQQRETQADVLLSAALDALKNRDIQSELDAWALRHPGLAILLRKSAKARFTRATKASEKDKHDNDPDAPRDDRESYRKYLYALGERALKLAAELDPGSADASPTVDQRDIEAFNASRLRALAEEQEGRYQSAYERIDPLIKWADSTLKNLTGEDDSAKRIRGELRGQWFSASTMRGRIATKWALQLHHQGDRQTIQRALRLVQGAIKDLENSARHADEEDDKEHPASDSAPSRCSGCDRPVGSSYQRYRLGPSQERSPLGAED